MTTFAIALCDDDKIFLAEAVQKLRAIIEHNGLTAEIDAYSSSEKLLLNLCDKNYSLVILDYEMPRYSGEDIANYIRDSHLVAKVIFLSSHSENAYRLFQYNIFAFIQKEDLVTNFELEVLRVINRIRSDEHSDNYMVLSAVDEKNERIILKLELSEIFYIESIIRKPYLIINDRRYCITGTGYECIKKVLVERGFAICHRTCVVNPLHILEIGESAILLNSGHNLPLSRRLRNNVIASVAQMIKEKYYVDDSSAII